MNVIVYLYPKGTLTLALGIWLLGSVDIDVTRKSQLALHASFESYA